jgi:hypothetical protein
MTKRPQLILYYKKKSLTMRALVASPFASAAFPRSFKFDHVR